jgi:uncharacterized membrane protein YfcA
MHNRLGNVELFPKIKFSKSNIIKSFKRKNKISNDMKVAIVIALSGIIGTVGAVFIAINISKVLMKLYVGILVLTLGVIILATRNKVFPFSWRKITLLSFVASFNKGLSGGGYGPVVTSGQMLSGVKGKNAIGITSFTEAFTCLTGIIIYSLTIDKINFSLFPYLICGGILSVPISGLAVNKINQKIHKVSIGIVTILLGIITLIKVF